MPRVSGSRTRSRTWTAKPSFTIGAGIGLLTIGAPPCQSRAPADQTATIRTVTSRNGDGMSSLARDILALTSTRVSRSRGTTVRSVRRGPCSGRRLVQLPHFALTFPNDVQEVFDESDGLFLRIGLDQRETADDLLGFRERPVFDGELAVRNPDARAQGSRQAALGAEEMAP